MGDTSPRPSGHFTLRTPTATGHPTMSTHGADACLRKMELWAGVRTYAAKEGCTTLTDVVSFYGINALELCFLFMYIRIYILLLLLLLLLYIYI